MTVIILKCIREKYVVKMRTDFHWSGKVSWRRIAVAVTTLIRFIRTQKLSNHINGCLILK
jgi:hypothetical protein